MKLVRWALDGEDRTASGCSVAQRHAWTDIHVRVDDGAGHANSVAVKGEHSDDANSSRNVFIADILRPRDVLNIKELVCSMQVPRRSLWLAQSGEVYFSSMVIRDPVTDEEVSTAPHISLSYYLGVIAGTFFVAHSHCPQQNSSQSSTSH